MNGVYSPRGDRCRTSYRGYPLEIANSSVAIFDRRRPSRRLATVASISTARRFIRGYRSDTVKAEPANGPAKVLAGSDEIGA